MGNEKSDPLLRRLIATLSTFGVTPSRAGPPAADAPKSDASLVTGRMASLRPPREDTPPGFVLGPGEHELIRLLEEVASNHRPARTMPRESCSFGRYMIVDEIGRGGSSLVYLATDPDLDRPVVLKVARPETMDDPERLRRFKLEGKVASLLDHPNIVPVHEVGEVDGLPYLAMVCVEGGTLADRLLGHASFPPRQASMLVREIAGAVAYAHDRGILNLDLTPRNIMLSPASPRHPDDLSVVPLVIDFGLAKLLDEGDGVLVGTPPYMAPELIREGSRGCGPTADVFALGVILYDLLVGCPPFLGESRLQTIRAVVEDDPVPPRHLCPSVPPMLEAICLRCLEKTPDRRYSTAHELQDDLERFLDGPHSDPEHVSLKDN
jgi:serine/threonine protein kinase